MARANPTRQTVLAAAEVDEEDLPTASEFDADLPADLEFEPVPRLVNRSNGLTPERQRAFIKMLSVCGSVVNAARAIRCSNASIYGLRNSPGAESFAAAWDRAVERGARRVLDVLVDQAINGTPEKVYKDGELVAERRVYNTRAMMWIVAHYLPERFGVTGGLMHSASGPIGLKRLKEAWRREWYEEERAAEPDPEETRASILRKLAAIQRPVLEEYYADPAKRAAYELLHGPDQWGDIGEIEVKMLPGPVWARAENED